MQMHIIGMKLMGAIRTIGSKLAWLLLLPGDSGMPGDGPQRSREQRFDTHAGQFAGVDDCWRRSRLSLGLTMPVTKFDQISEETIGRLVDELLR